MTLASIIHQTFQKTIEVFRKFIIPICLLASYLSAYRLLHPQTAMLFSRADLLRIHRFSGFLILFLLFLLAYDWLDSRFNPVGTKPAKGNFPVSFKDFNAPLRQLVNRIFYFYLGIMGLLGYFYFLAKKDLWTFLLTDTSMLLLHESLAWLFVALVATKAYLDLTQWAGKLIRYFKEY